MRAFSGDPARPDVWVFDRAAEDFLSLGRAGPVSAEDRARAERLRDPARALETLARRAAVRRVLALYLGRDAPSVRIVVLPGGKPTFVPEEGDALRLSYSSSHSGGVFLLAVGTAASLGVDVERLRPMPRAADIARRWFSEAEAASVEDLDPERREAAFFRLWTGKEALAKRHAQGLRLMGRLARGEGPDPLDVERETADGLLARFEPRRGYLGALASASVVEGVRLLDAPPLPA